LRGVLDRSAAGKREDQHRRFELGHQGNPASGDREVNSCEAF
jgi:hypothetical protein